MPCVDKCKRFGKNPPSDKVFAKFNYAKYIVQNDGFSKYYFTINHMRMMSKNYTS